MLDVRLAVWRYDLLRKLMGVPRKLHPLWTETRGWLRDIFESVRSIVRTTPRTMALIYAESGPLMVGYSISVVFLTAGPLVLSYLLGNLVDSLVERTGGQATAALPLLVLSMIVLMPILARYQGYLNEVLCGFLWGDLQVRASAATGYLDVAYHQDPELQDMLTRVRQHVQWRGASYADNQLLLLLNTVGVVIAAGMLHGAGRWPLLVLAATLPEFVVELSYSREERRIDLSHGERWRMFWDVRHHLQETSALIELRMFGNTGRFVDRLAACVRQNRKEVDRLRLRYLCYRLAVILLSHAVIFAAGWDLIGKAQSGAIAPGQLTFLIGALVGLAGAMSRLAANVRDLCRDCHLIAEFFHVVDLSSRSKRERDREAAVTAGTLPAAAATPVELSAETVPQVTFDEVVFRYPRGKTDALAGVTLGAKPGSKIAIVGDSGAGKTTLVNLLCGFHEPSGGSIRLGGVDLADVQPLSWESKLGVLLQNFQEYTPFTVREVMLLGTTEDPAYVTEERIRAAADEARALPFIEKLSGQFDQLLGKGYTGGAQLSRGEWQRLRLAAIFLRDPHFMLLDEPTSALDAENEAQIMNRLYRRDGRTLILITHRLSNCRDADWVYVMERGTVIEEGTHEDLVRHEGTYFRRFHQQRKGYS